MEDGDGSVHLHSCLALPSFLEGRLTAASTPRPPAPARWARADAPPAPRQPPAASSSPGGRVHPGDRPAPADARRPGSARPPSGGGGGSGGGARAHRWEQLRRAARRAGGCFLLCGRGRRPGGCGGRARLPRRRRVSVVAAGGPVTARGGRGPDCRGPRWLPQPEAASGAHLSAPGT